MVRYFVLLKVKGSNKLFGAIPGKRGTSPKKLLANARKTIKGTFSMTIITQKQLNIIVNRKKMIKKSRKKRVRSIQKKRR